MTAKIVYFTADTVATSAELAQIAILQAIAAAEYELLVMSGKAKAHLTGITLSAAAADNSYNDAGASIVAATISAAAADNSYNDSGSGFVTAGFQVGDIVTVSGFTGDTANNISAGRITALTAAKMTIGGTDGDVIVDDAAGETVTITAPGRFLVRGFQVGDTIFVRGFTGDVANNINSGVITALTAAKMTIGGTDGDVIVDDAAGESVTIDTVATDAKYGSVVAAGDYTAGTVPESYKSAGSPLYTLFDTADPPTPPSLIGTQAVVTTADVIPITSGSGTTSVTLTIAGNAITACVLA